MESDRIVLWLIANFLFRNDKEAKTHVQALCSSRLYRLDVSQAQIAKESGDERPRPGASLRMPSIFFFLSAIRSLISQFTFFAPNLIDIRKVGEIRQKSVVIRCPDLFFCVPRKHWKNRMNIPFESLAGRTVTRIRYRTNNTQPPSTLGFIQIHVSNSVKSQSRAENIISVLTEGRITIFIYYRIPLEPTNSGH